MFRHRPYYHRPRVWWKIRAICVQVLVPIIIFQCIRTFVLPTTFDLILTTLLIVFYIALRLRLL